MSGGGLVAWQKLIGCFGSKSPWGWEGGCAFVRLGIVMGEGGPSCREWWSDGILVDAPISREMWVMVMVSDGGWESQFVLADLLLISVVMGYFVK